MTDMLYGHVHPDDGLIPVFPEKPICQHEWEITKVDSTQLEQYGVTEVTLRCKKCGLEDREWWQKEDH